jgi:hypothetical protein
VHEFGHHFAGLADEYYTSSIAYELPEVIIEPYEPNITALLDPENLKWQHLATPNTHSIAYQEKRAAMRAENVPEAEMNDLFQTNQDIVESMFEESGQNGLVGAFEGGGYQQNCIMFTRTPDFCVVCSEAIEKVIDEYTLH